MKNIFSKIIRSDYELGSDRVEVRTHYFLFDWNFWTSKKQETASHQPSAEWTSLKQGEDGFLEVKLGNVTM